MESCAPQYIYNNIDDLLIHNLGAETFQSSSRDTFCPADIEFDPKIFSAYFDRVVLFCERASTTKSPLSEPRPLLRCPTPVCADQPLKSILKKMSSSSPTTPKPKVTFDLPPPPPPPPTTDLPKPKKPRADALPPSPPLTPPLSKKSKPRTKALSTSAAKTKLKAAVDATFDYNSDESLIPVSELNLSVMNRNYYDPVLKITMRNFDQRKLFKFFSEILDDSVCLSTNLRRYEYAELFFLYAINNQFCKSSDPNLTIKNIVKKICVEKKLDKVDTSFLRTYPFFKYYFNRSYKYKQVLGLKHGHEHAFVHTDLEIPEYFKVCLKIFRDSNINKIDDEVLLN